MRFTQDSTAAVHLIRAYAAGELRINNDIYRETVIVTAAEVQVLSDIPET
jgi:hypothetical protein